jgi:peptidoglycan-N-acetylglucosamine deacetylase
MTSLAQRNRHAWPDGALCVVGLTLDFDGTSVERGRNQLPYGARSHGRYSAKCGIPRFVDMFARQQVPWTFYVSGHDAEVSPDLVRAISRSGIEIGAHGYFHEGTHKLLTEVTGIAPRGWRSPSGHKTTRTLHKLRELGYVYDSSDKDFDLPYLARYGGREHKDYVCLPNNTSSLDDFPFYRVSYTPPSEVLTNWMQEFDAIYVEGGYFNLTVHPRVGYGSGSPARVAIVEKLIQFIKGYHGVRFVGMLELAQWCLEHPADWRRDWSGQ